MNPIIKSEQPQQLTENPNYHRALSLLNPGHRKGLNVFSSNREILQAIDEQIVNEEQAIMNGRYLLKIKANEKYSDIVSKAERAVSKLNTLKESILNQG